MLLLFLLKMFVTYVSKFLQELYILLIIKCNFELFLRYHLQNQSTHSDDVYWILICQNYCTKR